MPTFQCSFLPSFFSLHLNSKEQFPQRDIPTQITPHVPFSFKLPFLIRLYRLLCLILIATGWDIALLLYPKLPKTAFQHHKLPHKHFICLFIFMCLSLIMYFLSCERFCSATVLEPIKTSRRTTPSAFLRTTLVASPRPFITLLTGTLKNYRHSNTAWARRAGWI